MEAGVLPPHVSRLAQHDKGGEDRGSTPVHAVEVGGHEDARATLGLGALLTQPLHLA